ncbi:MAG: glycosyltransferase [Clostridiaceae bacterium]
MKKILYVYSNCSPQKYKSLVESSGIMILQQAQKYHQLMMEGLAGNGCDVQVISSLPVNRELTKKLFFKVENDEYKNIKYRYLSFINLPLLRNICIFINSFFTALKKKGHICICDILNISVSAGALLASRIIGNRTIGIVTDVPGMFSDGKNEEVPLTQKINRWILGKFDAYLFLTEQMNTLINREKHRPYIVIEGHADMSMSGSVNSLCNKYEKSVCIYSGSLKKIYGIKLLVQAFLEANIPNTELHIYGDGDYAEELKEISRNNQCIKYFGVKPNSHIVAEQLKAALLINPRPTNEEYTRYSFPSKNMEYMASGTPTLTTKLPGMPEEYNEYVYLIEEETAKGLSLALRSILSKPEEELHEKGMRAKEFVLHEKNNLIQSKKVLDMIINLGWNR